jgi:hypothetical protein
VDDELTHTVPNAPRLTTAEDVDDTDELPVLAHKPARDIRKYAKGFLLFYRARRILSGNRNIQTVTRERALFAWRYLASLTPKDLPPTLRQPYREVFSLAYRLDREDESQSPVKFVSKILEITTSIDQLVDDLLADMEKPV